MCRIRICKPCRNSLVPQNLCVKVIDEHYLPESAFTTIGAICINAIKNANISFGEEILIVGLGLIGIITAKICKEIGNKISVVEIDKNKRERFKKLCCIYSSFPNKKFDKIIVTAQSDDNKIIEECQKHIKSRGKIVVVGDIPLNLSRNEMYKTEASVIVSKSYGIGRYDRRYEEGDHDYPMDRTIKKNMESFVRLIPKLNLFEIIDKIYHLDEYPEAYNLKGIGILFEYPKKVNQEEVVYVKRENGRKSKKIGFIGSGQHALTTLLPILNKIKIEKKGFCGDFSVGKKYGFSYVTSNWKKITTDPEIDSVVISTRNSSHAKIVIDALKNNKNVYCEKPLCTTEEEFEEIVETYTTSPANLFIGYNRRYSPYIQEIKKKVVPPIIFNCRINAKKLPEGHWIHDPKEGGSLLFSELCHFIDLAYFFIDKHWRKYIQ